MSNNSRLLCPKSKSLFLNARRSR